MIAPTDGVPDVTETVGARWRRCDDPPVADCVSEADAGADMVALVTTAAVDVAAAEADSVCCVDPDVASALAVADALAVTLADCVSVAAGVSAAVPAALAEVG